MDDWAPEWLDGLYRLGKPLADELDTLDPHDAGQLYDFLSLLSADKEKALKHVLAVREQSARLKADLHQQKLAKAIAEAMRSSVVAPRAADLPGSTAPGQTVPSADAPLISDLVSRFIAAKEHSAAKSTIVAYRPICDLFCHGQNKLLGRRKDFYMHQAIEVVTGCNELILEKFDISQVARLEHPDGEENDLHAGARANRQLAAPHVLRDCIRWQAQRQNSGA